MSFPTKEYLAERLETKDIDDLEFPESIERIIFADSGETYRRDEKRPAFPIWLEEAENYDDIPHRSVFIPDYLDLNDELEEKLESMVEKDFDYPGLVGSQLAINAIKAQKMQPRVNFSAVIGFKVEDFDQNLNVNQVGSPQGVENFVNTPEWLGVDNWFSDLEEENYVGVIVDDDTVYARHIMDNMLLKENREYGFDSHFWNAYQEVIEGYTGFPVVEDPEGEDVELID